MNHVPGRSNGTVVRIDRDGDAVMDDYQSPDSIPPMLPTLVRPTHRRTRNELQFHERPSDRTFTSHQPLPPVSQLLLEPHQYTPTMPYILPAMNPHTNAPPRPLSPINSLQARFHAIRSRLNTPQDDINRAHIEGVTALEQQQQQQQLLQFRFGPPGSATPSATPSITDTRLPVGSTTQRILPPPNVDTRIQMSNHPLDTMRLPISSALLHPYEVSTRRQLRPQPTATNFLSDSTNAGELPGHPLRQSFVGHMMDDGNIGRTERLPMVRDTLNVARNVDRLIEAFDTIPVPRGRGFNSSSLELAQCVACMDSFPSKDILRLAACSCQYCRGCLNNAFRAGCASTAVFPPKCHGNPLRISAFGQDLDDDVVDRYKQVETEFATKKPLYCAIPTCSQFISNAQYDESGEFGICPRCEAKTCVACKSSCDEHPFITHGVPVCPDESFDTIALLDLGKQNEWKQCPSCENMVERIDGCNHIACTCGIEFCYNCASLYDENDSCACDTDEEDEDFDEMWPNHRLVMTNTGRMLCRHEHTDEVDGDLCHGCLRPPHNGILHSCIDCGVEFCRRCINSLKVDENRDLERPNRLSDIEDNDDDDGSLDFSTGDYDENDPDEDGSDDVV